MPEALKDFFLHKLSLRAIYIVGAFSTSHIIAFASSSKVQSVLSHAGVTFQVTDPDLLKTYLTGALLIGGEVVYHFIHTKFILPQVTPAKIGD